MAKQYKKWFKRKIIFKFKLQPIKSPTIPQYSKKSSNQFILKRFIKKFKPSRIRKIKFLLKKRVKKKIWLTWSFKKRNMFRKFSKLKRPSYIHNINPLPRLQYNNKIIYYILLINNQAFNIYNIWNYILHNKAIISYTIPASYKLNNNLNFLITSAIKKKKKQYIKKIILNKYAWYQDARFAKLKVMRKRLNRLINKFRKIKKNTAFNTLIYREFYTLTGLSINLFQTEWKKIRYNNTQYWGVNQSVAIFNARLLITPSNLLFLLGFAPSISSGNTIIKSGNLLCNGKICTIPTSLKPGDMLQLVQSTLFISKILYSIYINRFNSKLLFHLPFVYVDMTLLIIMLLRWPYTFEIIPSSFITPRWIRYYIRQISVKNKHNINNLWKIYLI